MKRFLSLRLSIATSVAISLMASAVDAEILVVHDTFTRTGALIGSTTDSGHVWTGSAATSNANGSELAVSGTSPTFATISGLTFVPNTTYRLLADIALTSGGSQWFSIGFSRPTSFNPAVATNGFFLRREDPAVETRVTASSSTTQGFAVADSFPDTLEIILVTGATLSDSLLSWQLNGTPLRTDEAADVTGIDGIFFANVTPFFGPAAVGTYDNLQLYAETIPEPSSAALAVIGAAVLGVLGVRRRRKTQRRV